MTFAASTGLEESLLSKQLAESASLDSTHAKLRQMKAMNDIKMKG